ncbi:MAG: hypothetical protein Q7N50_07415, partial [Armatimonadota bacterium]|nr:hypothetical protein [Armatimonadota bacterium]
MFKRNLAIMGAFALLFAVCCEAWPAGLIVHGDKTGQKWEGWGTSDAFSFDAIPVEAEADYPGEIPISGRHEVMKLFY